MVKIITGWLSEVTGEILATEREASSLDNSLLIKYNTKRLEEFVSETIKDMQSNFEELIAAGSKSKLGKGDPKLTDLYQAMFDRKISRSNRYYNANPLDILIEFEIVTRGGISDPAEKANSILENATTAREDYLIDNPGEEK